MEFFHCFYPILHIFSLDDLLAFFLYISHLLTQVIFYTCLTLCLPFFASHIYWVGGESGKMELKQKEKHSLSSLQRM